MIKQTKITTIFKEINLNCIKTYHISFIKQKHPSNTLLDSTTA